MMNPGREPQETDFKKKESRGAATERWLRMLRLTPQW